MNPYIQIPSHNLKFFHKNYHKGLEWYRNHMPMVLPSQKIVDKDPYYFDYDFVAKRIQEMNKDIKLIILLRNPVERMISDFKPTSDHTFEDAVLSKTGEVDEKFWLLRRSMYYKRLKSWSRYFSSNQILILESSDFVKNPVPVLNKVERFIGVPSLITQEHVVFVQKRGFYCKKPANTSICLSGSKEQHYPYVRGNVIDKLQQVFKEQDEKLSQMLGRTFSWQH